jgi:glycerol-3-phosphate O-acyltransferase
MSRIASVIPLLPVPLVCRAILDGATSEADITAHIETTLAALPKTVRPPRRSAEKMMQDGTAILHRRGAIGQGEKVTIIDAQRSVLQYYANSIAHHFPDLAEVRIPDLPKN